LLEAAIATTDQDMRDQATRILDLGANAVLLKGGHGNGPESSDLLMTRAGSHWFTAPRHDTQNTHGTGCTLSSAIAAGLAKGLALEEAVSAAKAYVTDAIRAADRLHIGRGHGPVHHFYGIWSE
jgi:hydroxymethylpyrimidine/phosphomethylpyrimidine kinase